MSILRSISKSITITAMVICSASFAGAVTPAGGSSHNPPDFVKLSEDLTPTVVNISAKKTIKTQQMRRMPQQQNPFGNEPFEDFFERFYRGMPNTPKSQSSLGSGVIISDDGDIITNYHVVADADEIMVKLSDHHEYKGKFSVRMRSLISPSLKSMRKGNCLMRFLETATK